MGAANELGLYALIKEILSQSMVIGGRFAVLKAAGEDVNTTNFAQSVQDALTGFTVEKKYPCCLMLPPSESEPIDDNGWSVFRCILFFLCPEYRTGDGDIKQPDTQTNVSTHTYQMDWKDMREVAGNFVKAFRTVTTAGSLPIRENAKVPVQYRRVSGIGNDGLNGIHLMYEVRIWNGINCGALADYPNDVTISITNFNPHPLHKQ